MNSKILIIFIVLSLLISPLISAIEIKSIEGKDFKEFISIPPPKENNEIIVENENIEHDETNTESENNEIDKTISKSTTNNFENIDPLRYSPKELDSLELEGNYQTNLISGAAEYNINVKVPPNTNDFIPKIEISYNNQRIKDQKSVIGHGWDLTNSYIERDRMYTVDDTSDDRFFLNIDNLRCKLVYIENEDRYHCEIENFLFIKKEISYQNQDNEYWIVKTKDGTIYRFGYNSESEIISTENPNLTWRWYLDQIEDTHNNKIIYSYDLNIYPKDSSAVYIRNIEYNQNRIEFIYENIGTERFIFYQGSKVRINGKLKEIRTFAQNNPVKTYRLNYDDNLLETISILGLDYQSILGSITFDYYPSIPNFTNISNWDLPEDLFFSRGYDEGVRFGDFNGDGLVDVIRSSARSQNGYSPSGITLWINKGNGWEEADDWQLPPDDKIFFVTQFDNVDSGTRVIDINGDGHDDMLRSWKEADNVYPRPTYRYVYINNGKGFIEDDDWNWPDDLFFYRGYTNGGYGNGVRFGDFNGDGLIDVIRSSATSQSGHNPSGITLWFNTGNGWEEADDWQLPPDDKIFFVDLPDMGDTGTRVIDINGDGYDDIIRSWKISDNHLPTQIYRYVYINNGKGFIEDDDWNWPDDLFFSRGYDEGVRFGDFNGDGLVDVIRSSARSQNGYSPSGITLWINKGNGWEEADDWQLPPDDKIFFVTQFDNVDSGTRVIDVNGDGYDDIIRKWKISDNHIPRTSYKFVYLNNNKVSNSLRKVTSILGSTTEIEYTQSTLFDNNGDDDISDIPFNVNVVDKIINKNGLNDDHFISSSTEYNYKDGLFDHDYLDQEFRGFKYVEEKKADDSTIRHWFFQDDAKKGKEYKVEVVDENNNLFQKILNTFSVYIRNDYYIVNIISEKEYKYDGNNNNPKISQIDYNYDNYGNIDKTIYLGDLSKDGDERFEETNYIYNENSWIVENPSSISLKKYDDMTKIQETYFTYNNKGDLLSEEYWLSNENNPVITYTYDSYGNVLSRTDENQNTINYYYDWTNTFIIKEKNAKNQEIEYNYDPGTGNLLSIEDPNGFITRYYYDIFGRKTKEILPYDSLNSPTIRYSYILEGIPPELIIIEKKEKNNEYFKEYYYYDGNGKIAQLKTEAEYSNFLSIDYLYDNKLRLKSFSNPYYSSSDYSATSNNKKTNYNYDILDRVTDITYPDNTKILLEYNRDITKLYDQNNNRKQYTKDAFGQIIQVKEYNEGETYITTYDYDEAGDLLTITDDQANQISYSYDTLGRKITLNDPDLGTWHYTYDAAGNLLTQTNNDNNQISFTYDELNRVETKNTPEGLTRYYYDQDTVGTLSSVETPNLTKNFEYDNKLRMTDQEVLLDENTFETTYQYDSMDRIIRKILPNGEIIDYDYNDQGMMENIDGIINNINYNNFGKIESRTYANSLQTNFEYNSDNSKLKRINTGNKQDLKYQYDNKNNILQINDAKNYKIETFSYDDLDRLKTASKTDDYDITYNYDSIGNMMSLSSNLYDIDFSYAGNTHAPSSIIIDSNSIECNSNADCGTDGWTGTPSCNGNDIYQNYRTWTCNIPGTINADCVSTQASQLKQECNDICYNGQCINAECNSNANCGTDGWTGTPSCNGDNIYQNYRTWICNDPGTAQADCSDSVSYTLKASCQNGCSNGQCTSTNQDTIIWHIDHQNDKIYKLAADGTILDSFDTPSSTPYDITTDRQYLWTTDPITDEIYKINHQGDIILTLEAPSSFPTGIALDGQYLWNADMGSDKIYKLSTDGTIVKEIDAPGEQTYSLDYDGQYLWVVDYKSKTIFEIDTDGNVITQIKTPGSGPFGIHKDGQYLWHTDFNIKRIYKLSLTGEIIEEMPSPGNMPVGITIEK